MYRIDKHKDLHSMHIMHEQSVPNCSLKTDQLRRDKVTTAEKRRNKPHIEAVSASSLLVELCKEAHVSLLIRVLKNSLKNNKLEPQH